MKPAVILLVALLSSGLFSFSALACTECHSKNPKMVRMHEALGFKDCFNCHGPAAKKSGDVPEKQMMTDGRCVRCHNKSAVTKPR